MKAIREQIPLRSNESFSAYQYSGPEFDAPYHFHPEIEVVYIEAGKGFRIVGDHTGSFYPGDLCLFGGNLPHFYHADSTSKRASSLVIQFLPELMDSVVSTTEMAPVQRLMKLAQQGVCFSRYQSTETVDLMRKVIDSNGPDRLLTLLHLLTNLTRVPESQPLASLGFLHDPDQEQTARIERIWTILMHRFSEEISQASVAYEMNMSTSAFSRLFRRATNMTFTDALIEIRLGHACRQLQENDSTISEICFNSGFNNLSNFNRHFKKRYGVSPREWRQQLDV
ncbi:MAG: AraC family transcriptional regulator [Verrucomicrobiota bacterium]